MDLPAPPIAAPAPAPSFPAPRAATPPPAREVPGAFDFSAAEFDGDFGDADLPAPVDLDLPAPVDGLDLPAPVDFGLDLPTPVDGLDLPAPAYLDLPAPLDDLPMPADDLPMPAENLPMPAENLPMPAENLRRPASADRARPRGPRERDHGDVELDFDAGDPPARTMIPSLPSPTGAGANLVDARDSKVPPVAGRMAHMTSPAPTKGARAPLPKPLIYGGLAATLLIVALGGAFVAGVFDGGGDEAYEPKTLSAKPGERDEPVEKLAPGEVAERSDGVLEMFDEDTPAAYTKAIASTETLGDRVGQAEAALLIHHRYGPDAVHLGQAHALLEDYTANQESHVTRVFGLQALAAGDLAAAEKLLTGTDPRSQLYLAWLRLAQGRPAEAAALVEPLSKARPADLGVTWTAKVAGVELDATGGLAALRSAAEAQPKHARLQQSLVRALLAHGLLAEAAERGQALESNRNASAEHQAAILELRAQIAIAQGNQGEAIRLQEQAIALAPESIEVQVARLRSLFAAHNLTELRADLDGFLRDHPDHRGALIVSARAHLETGQGDKALATLAKIPDAATIAEVHEITGDILAMRMSLEDARKSYAKARELAPLSASATVREARLLASAQRGPEAVDFLVTARAALEADERAKSTTGRMSIAAIELERARILLAENRVDEATAALDAALAIDPTNNDARLLHGSVLTAAGKRDEAESVLIELHERTGGYPGLAGPVGEVYLRRGELEKLDGLLGKHLDEEGASDDVLLTGALLRLRQGKPDPASALVERVIARNPASWQARLVKTQILVDQSDFEGALVEINQAQAPQANAMVELWKGKALEYNGRSREAERYYRRAMEIDPALLEAAALYGRSLAYAGAAKQAIELLEPVVAATDDFAYARVALGRARSDIGQHDEAIAQFKRAQELDARSFEAFYWEGRLHSDRNRHAQAVRALQRATEVASGNEGTYLHDAYRRLGAAHKAAGNSAGAKAAWSKYLELAPADAPGRASVQRELAGI